MAITFNDETALPPVEKENEFREVVKWLAANPGAVKSYVVSEKTVEDSQARVDADKRKMAEAANELDKPVTIRTPRREVLDDGKSVKVYLTTNGKKIERKRKPTTPAAETPATPAKAAPAAKK